jgi:thiosulfate/3-mercaptopyruvate sulfurtransferase
MKSFAAGNLVRVCGIVLVTAAVVLLVGADQPTAGPSTDLSPGSAQVISPEDLMKMLQSSNSYKLIIMQVGFHKLYDQAHIPNSEYIGAGSTASGLQQLQTRVQGVKKNTPIVLYCGCCPWDHCPNVKPAYAALHELGFTNVKVLYIAHNFGADWVDKGYLIEGRR